MKKMHAILCAGVALLALTSTAASATVDFDPAAPAPGNMRFTWIHGSISALHNTDPRIQVHRYNEHTYILRQNAAVHWEAPFMYLLMGETGAVLIDVGATEEPEYFPLRETVDRLLSRWAFANGVAEPELTVLSTSNQQAQTAAIGQFADRANTTVIASDVAAMTAAFDLEWPTGTATLDLGGRKLTLLPSPGVADTGLSIYDPYTDFLFTGTAFLAGRIVIRDPEAYEASLERLLAFIDTTPVKWLMGGQVDMSDSPGVDHRLRSNYRPFEHALEMTPDRLQVCYDIVHLMNGRAGIEVLPDFIVMSGVGRGARAYGYPVYTPEFVFRRRLR